MEQKRQSRSTAYSQSILISSSQVTPSHNGVNRFSRIKANVEVHPGLTSNEYNAGESNYGAKASKDLIVTRGDGFRKEKQKKKRGSYRGGAIDFESRSFKFED
jgi:SRP40, C-terminal domain